MHAKQTEGFLGVDALDEHEHPHGLVDDRTPAPDAMHGLRDTLVHRGLHRCGEIIGGHILSSRKSASAGAAGRTATRRSMFGIFPPGADTKMTIS